MKLRSFKRAVLYFVWGGSLVPSSAVSLSGAGGDTGVKESSVRLLRSPEATLPEELSISLGNENYVSRSATATGTTTYTDVSARVRAQTQGPILFAKIDAGASAANVSNSSNFEVPEVYFTAAYPFGTSAADVSAPRKFVPFLQLSVGRKKERWSGIDSDWSLGLVQPFNKFDALRPTEQGLVGAFAEGGIDVFNVELYASPFFLPEQGAPYTLSNGRFSTTSPWFTTPPATLIYTGVERPVYYSINLPDTSQVIAHSSYGARMRLADPSGEGFYAQGSFLRAPQNSIALSFTGDLQLRDSTTYFAVTVEPEVVYHTVTAAEAGYKNLNFAAEMAMLSELPDQPTASPTLTTSRFSPMTILSPSIEARVLPSQIWGPRIRLSYLDSHGGEVSTTGVNASTGNNIFGSRTIVRRAVTAAVESTFYRSPKWSLQGSARWIEELSEGGSALLTDFRLGLGSRWAISLQGDFIGSRQATTVTDTFIARYRANDRAAARLTYLF